MKARLTKAFQLCPRRLTIQAQAQAQAGELVTWVQRSGGQVQGVAVQQWDGEGETAGFGLKALQDCRAGFCLIDLPQRCHLTYDLATTDPRLLALINQVPAELWGAKLALQVLAHRVQGEASPFATYIANLPMGVPGLPMFFTGEALAALQYPPLTEQARQGRGPGQGRVKKRCRWLLAFSQQVLGPLQGTPQDPFEGATVDANALGWALGVVTSRAFRTRGPAHPAAMLPLIDMANHSFEPNCKIAAAGSGVSMVATRDVAAGEPLLLNYGSLPNDLLLLDYGFVVPGNAFETVQLRFDPGLIEAAKAVGGVGSSPGAAAGDALPPWQQAPLRTLSLLGDQANTEVCIRRAHPQRQQQQQLDSRNSLKDNSRSTSDVSAGSSIPAAHAQQQQQVGKASGGDSSSSSSSSSSGKGLADACPVDSRLLAAVRVLCAKSAAELSSKEAQKQLGAWDKPLSLAGEVAALRTLSGLCLIALSQFTTSLADDRRALDAGGTAAGEGGGNSSRASGEAQQHEEAQQQQQQKEEWQPLSADLRLALLFRMEKKQLLLDALDVLSGKIKELVERRGGAEADPSPAVSKPGKGKVPAAKHGGKGSARNSGFLGSRPQLHSRRVAPAVERGLAVQVRDDSVLIVNTKGGGHAFLGLHLARKLIADGHKVTILNDGDKNKLASKMPFAEYPYLRADIVWGDPANPATYPRGRFDVVYDNNGKDLDTCRPLVDHYRGSVRNFVFVGSAGAYSANDVEPMHVEGDKRKSSAGHVAVEHYLEEQRLPYTVFQPLYIYGAYTAKDCEQWFMERILRDRPVPIPGPGTQLTSLSHVDDLADMMARVPGNRRAVGQHFNLCSDRCITFDGIAKAIAAAAGREAKIVHYDPAKVGLKKGEGFPFRAVHFFASSDKAKRVLDWKPRHNFLRDVDQLVREFKASGRLEKQPDFSVDDKILAAVEGRAPPVASTSSTGNGNGSRAGAHTSSPQHAANYSPEQLEFLARKRATSQTPAPPAVRASLGSSGNGKAAGNGNGNGAVQGYVVAGLLSPEEAATFSADQIEFLVRRRKA
ncbi:hypothetical protein N2152v2_003709 [Parachlorella kessleri]